MASVSTAASVTRSGGSDTENNVPGGLDLNLSTLYVSLGIATVVAAEITALFSEPLAALLTFLVFYMTVMGYYMWVTSWDTHNELLKPWRQMFLYIARTAYSVVLLVAGQLVAVFLTSIVTRSNSVVGTIVNPVLAIALFVLVAVIVIRQLQVTPSEIILPLPTEREEMIALRKRVDLLEKKLAALSVANNESEYFNQA